jgi:hypothetical protein
MGNTKDSLKQFEMFQSRKDLQLPVTVALLHIQKMQVPLDRDAISALNSEIPIAEDLAVSIILFVVDTP